MNEELYMSMGYNLVIADHGDILQQLFSRSGTLDDIKSRQKLVERPSHATL